MRLTSFSLESYGNFEAVRLSLDPHPGHINLVVAPNGGGKTVLRRGFRDLLFGIPGQTQMAFRFGYAGMRLFAEGVDGDGTRFAIGRRKGIGSTLIDAQGNSLDPRILKQLIGEADETLFERLFALDSNLLRCGAEAMLASGGDIAEALFAAGSGIAGVRRVRSEFEAMRDELAPGRQAKARPFYQALDALAKARSDLRASTIRPQTWQESSTKLTFTRQQRASLTAEQARGQAETDRLQRIKRVRPWLQQLEGTRQQCAASAGAPRLPADTEDRWREALQAVELAERELNAATDRLQGITASLAAEQPDRKLLEEREPIEELAQAGEKISADRRDLPRREAEHGQTAARLEEVLLALEAKSADEIAAIAPNGPRISAARDLIKQHGILTERLRKAQAEATKIEREIATAEAALGQFSEPDDTGDLIEVVAVARAEGEPARRIAGLQAQLKQEEARLAASLAKVPLWKHPLEALVAVVPPTRQVVDRAAAMLESARAVMTEADRELNRFRDQRREAAKRLARHREGSPVPDAVAIAAARARRDSGWSLIRRSKFEGEAPEVEIEAYAGPLGLATMFERAIDNADDLADRREEESRRLAAIAEQEWTIAELDEQVSAAEQRLVDVRKAHKDALRGWSALAALGFAEVPEAADLRDFITAREAVLDARAARDIAQQAVAAEMERQEAAGRRFVKLLPANKCASLTEALAAAQQVIDRCAVTRQKRERLQAQLDTFRSLHRQGLDERNTAERALAKWQADWRECLSNLKRPLTEMPAAVEKAIELIEEAHRERQNLGDLEHRIMGMKENIADFDARVADLVIAVAPDLIGQSVEAGARELRKRLAVNREIEARCALLLGQEKDARAKRAEAVTRHDGAQAMRGALREMIGGGSDEEIASRIPVAVRRATAEAKLREIEAKLAEIGDGWSIDALEREVAAVPAEAVETELARLQVDAERITTERETAAAEEQRLRDELRRMEADEKAIDAEERRQAAMASATRISGEALMYHAAECLLRHGIERMRNSGDTGLVQRIGAVFAEITGGAYASVAADEDERGVPFLIAVEADGTTTKRVDQLSEGTRDQLFLALRLIMLEDYAVKAPALPFIADDLLQTFDDYGRTEHALAALADLSHHVQVIVLSHRRQLIDIAQALPPDTVNVCDLAA